MAETVDPARQDDVPERADQKPERLLAVVRSLVLDLHPRKQTGLSLDLDSRLDRDLGIDSLGRSELLLRVEGAFQVRLPETLLAEAETVGDLLAALETASERLPALEGQSPVPMAPDLPVVVETPTKARTLPEVLAWHLERHPDRPQVTLLKDEREVETTLTYRDLAERSKAVAHGLRARGIEAGDRIALMLPTGADFFVSFFGILQAGAVPVTIYPPLRLTQLEEHMRRQAGILRSAGARILVASKETKPAATLLELQLETLDAVATTAELSLESEDELPVWKDGEAIAFIQYTSGSTGDPKGVTLSHTNLLANIRAMGEALEAKSSDVFVSWLPLYHDMGLIGAWLGNLYHACPLYVMSPTTFLVRPAAWLWAIHRYRATMTAAPNFAFEFCVSRIEEEALEGLDLSSLRVMANGAEAVSARTLDRFAERFQRYGFRREAMMPVYGMAENAVGLSFPPLERGPLSDHVDREAFSTRGEARPAAEDDPKAIAFVACGHALPGHEIRVVDQTGREAPDRREGRIQFRGPSSTRGYFNNEAATQGLFDGDWVETGDRGYAIAGEIYVTGRIKDIIIRSGRNVYPQELEEAVGELAGVRKGCVAVFGSGDETSGTEIIVVLAETRESEPAARQALQQRITETATELLGMPPEEVVLAPPRSVPKTSSGKLRRAAAKQLYETGGIGKASRALWLQVVRLAALGLGGRLRHWFQLAGALGYAGYWWLVMGPGLLLIWMLIRVTPRLSSRWRIVRTLGRPVLRLAGVPPKVDGLRNLPAKGAVLVCNHASYLDPLVMATVLPGEPVFVAKRELEPQFFAGSLLRGLGVLFVERHAPEAGVADTQEILALAKARQLLVLYPEGTFGRGAGLLPFRLGAFVVAAEAGLPVVPATIRGTRSILRDSDWFPRRGRVELEIGPAIEPPGQGFDAALELRKAARAWILAHCGEPDAEREEG
ncbi:MAG: AMP-binding protein [Kiloniellales bacterium]|nr:AMP-binding protein [Kiloniellales bacterium]